MIGSFQTGVSGLQQFQQDLEVIGNNIANVNTNGFKASRMEFEDAFSQSLNNGSPSLQIGTGVQTSTISSFYEQGTINNTGVATDLAVVNSGFFVVRDPSNGAQYVTRDGAFNLDANGFLETNDHMRVQGYVGVGPFTPASTIGDIQINAATAATSLGVANLPAVLNGFNIDSAGQVNVRLTDSLGASVNGVMAQVVLQNFTNPQALVKQGQNLYTFGTTAGALAAAAAPSTVGLGTIRSGALESSNVDLGNEMAQLITAQRAFQANAKIVTTSDECLQDLVNLKR